MSFYRGLSSLDLLGDLLERLFVAKQFHECVQYFSCQDNCCKWTFHTKQFNFRMLLCLTLQSANIPEKTSSVCKKSSLLRLKRCEKKNSANAFSLPPFMLSSTLLYGWKMLCKRKDLLLIAELVLVFCISVVQYTLHSCILCHTIISACVCIRVRLHYVAQPCDVIHVIIWLLFAMVSDPLETKSGGRIQSCVC